MGAFQVSAYVNFQGKAREALEFYQQALGGQLELFTMDEQGGARPAAPGERIAQGRLVADGARIYGSDGHPTFPPTVGDNTALALSGSDKEQLTAIFTALAEGGRIKAAIHKQPWGAEVGWLVDQFGVNWMVTVEQA
jgi:PhnB protein